MRLNQFDGLRFLASMTVVASHTAALGLYGQGGVMVSLFFVLSGFFMAMPVKKDGEEKFLSPKGWIVFYVNRIVRIIPLYWGSLLLVYWLFDKVFVNPQQLLQNMFFVNCWGHLWFLQHEMLCYVLAPVLMLLIALVKKYLKVPDFGIGAGIFVLSIAVHYYFNYVSGFRLMGNGKPQPFRIGLFVLGIAFGYIYKSGILHTIKGRGLSLALDAISALIMAGVFVSAPRFLEKINPALKNYMVGWTLPWVCGFVGGILLLLLAVNPGGIISRLLSLKWFVRFGRASYGIYVLHFFMLSMITFSTSLKNFAAAALLSSCAAVVFYEWMEEPLAQYVKQLLNRIPFLSGKAQRTA